MTVPREPRVRQAPIPDDAVLVVRGDDLNPDTARSQAVAFRQRFPDWGRWGLSGFYARSEAEIEDIAADQLERFPLLVVFETGQLRAAGFDVVPTFRTPHVTIAFSDDLDAALSRLVVLGVNHRPNPYHEHEPRDEGGGR